VRNYLEELETKGFIRRVKRCDNRGRTTDVYEFIEHPIFAPGYRNTSSAVDASLKEQRFRRF
jgi:predicted ArsR family transcriptional regulator